MSNPVETGVQATAIAPDAQDAEGVMFDTASEVMFEHLKRSSLSAQTHSAAPLASDAAADLQMNG